MGQALKMKTDAPILSTKFTKHLTAKICVGLVTIRPPDGFHGPLLVSWRTILQRDALGAGREKRIQVGPNHNSSHLYKILA